MGEGVFWGDDPVSEERIPTSVLNEELAQLVFKQENIAQGRPEGWYLASRTARPLLFSTSLFHQRTAGDLILLTPTSTGARNLNFMSLFNSFREYIASESEKTKKLREHIYNQVLALFHGDSKGLFKDKLGWSKGPNNKQVKVSKIPEVATDLIEKKFSPPRRVVKPSIYFVGEEGTSEAAFLRTINSKQTFKIGAEATMFKGEFWDPKKRDEEALEASRSSLQREANSCLNVEGIIDIAETAASANQPEMSPVAKDLFLKVKALAMKTLRLREPSLASAVNDFAAKIRTFRGQIIKALAPARVREPLMEAPIFSEDTNIFPTDVLTSVNTLATTLDDKLVLPKESTRRYPIKPAYQKRPFQSQDRAAEPQAKRIRGEAPAPRLAAPPQRDPRLQNQKDAQQPFRSNKAHPPSQNKGRKHNKPRKQHFPARKNAGKNVAPNGKTPKSQ